MSGYWYRGALPIVVCLTDCDLETSTMRRLRPTGAVEP